VVRGDLLARRVRRQEQAGRPTGRPTEHGCESHDEPPVARRPGHEVAVVTEDGEGFCSAGLPVVHP